MEEQMKKCFDGNHDLISIYETNGFMPGERECVRWCTNCGSIVVDCEQDSQIFPGAIMKMKSPNISKELYKQHKINENGKC